MEKTNLENLNRLAKLFGTDRLISPEDIQEIRSILIGVLANNKKEVESLTEETKQAINSVLEKVLNEHDTYLEKTKQIAQEAKSETTEAINSTLKSLEEVKALCKEVMECKPENGEDADEEYVIGEVLNRIKLPEYKEIVLDDGSAIVDKINSLPVNEENQIDAKHIKNLPEVKNGRVISGGVTRKIVEQMIADSGAAGVTLKVGGTNNIDQGTLDLIAGSGMTIVDNGDGSVTFTSSGGSGTPGGSTTQLQYNNAGAFGGITGATTNGTAVTYTTGNLKGADVKASSSAGLQILSNAGTVTSLHGAGGGANNTFYGGIKGDYLTASEMLITDDSKNIVSAPVATYPSLTELTYLKGVTSAIQTQLDAKVDENSAITGATKTKITYDAKGLVTGGADATTADIADTTNKRYVTDAQLTVIGNTSGTNTGDQTTITGNSGTATALQTARTIGTITGDATSAGSTFDGSANNTNALTLATVNSNVGTFGSATQASQVTVNAKGLVTAASSTTITPAVGSITGLGTGVGTFLATPSSANLAAALTDETGSGSAVFGTSPTLTTPTLQASKIDYVIEPATDDTFEGEMTNDVLAGDTIAQWDMVYLDNTSGRWEKTDADAIGTAGNVLIAMAAEAGTDGNAMNVVFRGIVRNDGWTWSVKGAPLYLSTTASAISETAPSGEDDVVRIVGHVISDDCIYLNPSPNWIIYKS